jgi:hypothetical protein
MTDRRDDRGSMRPTSGQRQPAPEPAYDEPRRRGGGYQRQTVVEAAMKSFIRSIASSIGRILVRSLTGGRR